MEDTNYLAHHGILGQKWGIRRFQNKDGSLTPEGKERYGNSKNAEDLSDNYKKLYNGMKDLAELPPPYMANQDDPDIRDAAKLGLTALKKMDKVFDVNELDPESSDWREWFVAEDQTYGMPEVALMVNKGYSKEKIKELIRLSENLSDNSAIDKLDAVGKSEFIKNFLFAAAQGNYQNALIDFTDKCFEVKNEAKHSDDTNYLAHHGIEGQKWGIRRYQNEDGTLTPAGRERYGYTGYDKDKYLKKEAKANEKEYKRNLREAKRAYKEDLKSAEAYLNTKNYGEKRRDYEWKEAKREAKSIYRENKAEIKADYNAIRADIAAALGDRNTGNKAAFGFLAGLGATGIGKVMSSSDSASVKMIGKILKGAGRTTYMSSLAIGGYKLAKEKSILNKL